MALSESFMSTPGRSMNNATTALDIQGLNEIKTQAKSDRDGALRQVSQQFEAMFMDMIMKSMRSATKSLNEDSIFNSQHTEFFQEMHDKELVQNMTQSGGLGLAEALYEQLSQAERQATGNSVPVVPLDQDGRATLPARTTRETSLATPTVSGSPAAPQDDFNSPEDFVRALLPAARTTARKLGGDARYLLAQAALETGWGQQVIGHKDGTSSHNLFNIKADQRWDGPSARVLTREYLGGRPVQMEAAFRSYDSFADSFSDYFDFLHGNARYGDALAQADDGPAYVQALQKAGYATDPAYAEKIQRIAQSPWLDQLNQPDLARTQ